MLKTTNRNLGLSMIAALTLLASTEGILLAQKMSVPKALPDRAALAEEDVKELLLLMDTDQDGKITKKEWMKFMEAEFDRLDTKKTGELDPKELAKSRLRPSPFAKAGK